MSALLECRPPPPRARCWPLAGVLLAVLALLGLCLAAGSYWIGPRALLQALLGGAPAEQLFVLHSLRGPRIALAFLVGAGLALAGLILQGLIRNPLASPDLIGITGGASAAAVAYIAYLSAAWGPQGLPLAALLGAGLTTLGVYLLAWRGGVAPLRLILVGIGLSAGLAALTTLMIVQSPIATSMSAYIWLTGSVYGADWAQVRALLPWLLGALPLALLLGRSLDAQALGDAVALNLGVALPRHRLLLLLLCVALAGSAVAYGGAIGFVGLIAPHLARRLVACRFVQLAPLSALLGGTLVVAADTLGRSAFLPLDIPAGVFVAALGAPFFLYLLYRRNPG